MKTLYVTGEESLQQVACVRTVLGLPTANLGMLSKPASSGYCLIAEEERAETDGDRLHTGDYIWRTFQSSPGQRRRGPRNGTAAYLSALRQNARRRGDRDGRPRHQEDRSLAGPKCWNTVSIAQYCSTATPISRFRTLRSHKNRFGAVNELGVFAMTEQGVARSEQSNPPSFKPWREVTSGSSVMVVWEGTHDRC